MSQKIYSGSTLGQGTQTSATTSSTFFKPSVASEISLLEPLQYPLTTLMLLNSGAKKTTVHPQGQFQWIDDEIIWNDDTLGGAFSGGSTTGTLTVSTANLWVNNTIGYFEESGESFIVNSGGGTTSLTILKLGSGNFTSVSSGSVVSTAGIAQGEMDDVPTPMNTKGTFRTGYAQIFEASAGISKVSFAASKGGGFHGGDLWADDIKKGAYAFKRDIELNFSGTQGADYLTSTKRAINGGLFYQIENQGGQALSYSGTLDEDEFDGVIEKLTYGSPYKIFMVGTTLGNYVYQIMKKRRQLTDAVKKTYSIVEGAPSLNVVTYNINGIELDIIKNPLWNGVKKKWGAFFEAKDIVPYAMANDNDGSRYFRLEEYIQNPKDPYYLHKWLAHVGLAVKNCGAHATLKPLV